MIWRVDSAAVIMPGVLALHLSNSAEITGLHAWVWLPVFDAQTALL